ncbi:hypothetical protein CSUI_008255 [Cystoisospora suis]|uniref:Uncharacterized protein n=1 Tax=Cystoisospora suis TaxID=483139 RepID=A0A2C6KAD6_9APIC|nr:hypothetical protein CSUI_008255 [Cystoisospora suis]
MSRFLQILTTEQPCCLPTDEHSAAATGQSLRDAVQAVTSSFFPLNINSLATLLQVLPTKLTLDHCLFTPLLCQLEEHCFKGQRRDTRDKARRAAVNWLIDILSSSLTAPTPGRAPQAHGNAVSNAAVQIVQRVLSPVLSPEAGFHLAVEQVDVLKPLIALESCETQYHAEKANVLLASG